jgi:hypothetical protein
MNESAEHVANMFGSILFQSIPVTDLSCTLAICCSGWACSMSNSATLRLCAESSRCLSGCAGLNCRL